MQVQVSPRVHRMLRSGALLHAPESGRVGLSRRPGDKGRDDVVDVAVQADSGPIVPNRGAGFAPEPAIGVRDFGDRSRRLCA